MKKILFICNAGMSTAFLVQQLNKKVKEKGLDWTFDAQTLANFASECKGVDLLCVAPQVASNFEIIKKTGQNNAVKKFYQIKMSEYNILKADELIASIKEVI